MKKYIYIFYLVFLFWVNGGAQNSITIPDNNFATYLRQAYPGCMNVLQLDTICSAGITDTLINCPTYNITNLTGVQYFKNLLSLYCYGNAITSLPPLPPTLQLLSCGKSHLSVLPTLPSGLKTLNCDSAGLTALPTLPPSLRALQIEANHLTSLPTLPDSLTILQCSFNRLASLPALPVGITDFECAYNLLTGLPTLPDSLVTFDCSYDSLNSLPPLVSTNLQIFNCESNRLTVMPDLPATLLRMICAMNQIAAMPPLPPRLYSIICNNNLITAFATMNDSLIDLYADFNKLVTFPGLSATLRNFSCAQNQLSSLPPLPDTLIFLNLFNNANLLCLPPFKVLYGLDGQFIIGGTGITCLPNSIQHPLVSSLPNIDTVPICGLFNPSGCQVAWNIYGRVTIDTSDNCSNLASPSGLIPVKVNLNDNNGQLLQQEYSNASTGSFSFLVQPGIYQVSVDTTNLPFNVSCPTNNLYIDTISTNDSLNFSNNFGLTCKNTYDLAAQSITGQFVPGAFSLLHISAGNLANWYGAGCDSGLGGTVTLNMFGPVSYFSPAPGAITPSSVIGDSITWNISDFNSISFESSFNVMVQTDTGAQIGQGICMTLVITPVAGDDNPLNNVLTRCFIIKSSFDPNEKEVDPISYIDTGSKWLTYTIFFQNTGTSRAENIYLVDTLDIHLDPSSFQLIAYSFKTVTIINDRIVQFNFPNINLPDSGSNQPASHGYVVFKIKLKDNQPIGAEVTNSANIFFDFNTSVTTDTTKNTITASIPTAIQSSPPGNKIGLIVFPNPATDKLILQPTGFVPEFISVFDVNGRALTELKFIPQIDISNLSPGIYFIEVKGEDAAIRNRFVKM